MSQSLLHTYYLQRIKQVFNHLHDFDSSLSETDLHDFRVELKKLRAILKFLSKVYSKQELKQSIRLLANIFQQAGDIREYQLLQHWLEKNDLTVLKKSCFPENRLLEMMGLFQQQTHLYKLELKEMADHLVEYVLSTNGILAEQYAIDLYAKINKMVAKDCTELHWHDLRKLIKQWQYACNWTEDKGGNQDKPFFHKLQVAIGNWHDLLTISHQLLHKRKAISSHKKQFMELAIAQQKLDKLLKAKKREVSELLNKKMVAV